MKKHNILLPYPGEWEGLHTTYIQQALDTCRDGGGEVTLADGLWKIGTIRIFSNTTLRLSAGTVLQGSEDIRDYTDLHVPTTMRYVYSPWMQQAWHLPPHYIMAPIVAFDAENVAVIGEPGAVIDGSDCYDAEGEEGFRGPMGMVMSNCRNVTLRGYTYRRSANWAHQLDSCTNVHMEKVTVLGGHDGINVHHCTYVTVEDCDFRTGDDCVAGYDAEYVRFRRCSFNSSCSAFRFGGRDLIVEDCRFWGPGEYPHRISGRHNTLTAFLYYSMVYDDMRHNSGQWLIQNCTIENVDTLLDYNYGKDLCQQGRYLTDVTFKDVKITGLLKPSIMTPPPGAPLKVLMQNVTMEKRKDAPAGGLFITSRELTLTLDNTRIEGLNG